MVYKLISKKIEKINIYNLLYYINIIFLQETNNVNYHSDDRKSSPIPSQGW